MAARKKDTEPETAVSDAADVAAVDADGGQVDAPPSSDHCPPDPAVVGPDGRPLT